MPGSALSLSLTLATLTERLRSAGARLVGDPSVRVDSIDDDSREIAVGGLFVARSGQRESGVHFVDAAVGRGALAVLTGRDSGVGFEPRIELDDVALGFGLAAQELAGRPADTLQIVGITGTNGKTTTASLVDQALRFLRIPSARLGTLGFFIGDELIFDTLTTPLPHRLAESLALAKERGVRVVVMEVSSHALAQKRVAGVRFEVAAFTNLSQDHLDYHETLEAYGAAKARLFFEHAPAHSVIFTGSDFGRELAGRLPSALTASREPHTGARLSVERSRIGSAGIEAELSLGETTLSLRSRLLGAHNLENLLVALGILLSLGIDAEQAAFALAQAGNVPGRLERCDGPEDDLLAVVDYAHTPDALSRVLGALRAIGDRPLVCVFGCGGDRDRSKRAPMAQAVADGADIIWLTSDNPRYEDPAQISSDVRAGLPEGCEFFEEPDRARAIDRAILTAPEGAMILVAGKGHETYQLVGDQRLSFDDRQRTREALAKRRMLRQETQA